MCLSICAVALRSWRCPEFQKDIKLTLGNEKESFQNTACKGTTCKNTLFSQYLLCLSFSSLRSPVIFPYSLHLFLVFPPYCGPGSSVGIATDYGLDGPWIESRWGEIFRCPDRPWGPPSLLHNGYRVFPGGKVRPGRAANHSSPSSAAVMEE